MHFESRIRKVSSGGVGNPLFSATVTKASRASSSSILPLPVKSAMRKCVFAVAASIEGFASSLLFGEIEPLVACRACRASNASHMSAIANALPTRSRRAGCTAPVVCVGVGKCVNVNVCLCSNTRNALRQYRAVIGVNSLRFGFASLDFCMHAVAICSQNKAQPGRWVGASGQRGRGAG